MNRFNEISFRSDDYDRVASRLQEVEERNEKLVSLLKRCYQVYVTCEDDRELFETERKDIERIIRESER
jgi:hypothetical protein